MRLTALFSLLVVTGLASAGTMTLAQSAKGFPSADTMLKDAKHKEPKSGVQVGPGNSITIQSGVGTPTTINVLSFGKGGTLLAAGKDFGRVVVWDVENHKFLCAADAGQGLFMLSRFLLTVKCWLLAEKVTILALSCGTSLIVGLSTGMTPSLDTYTRWRLTQMALGLFCQTTPPRHK